MAQLPPAISLRLKGKNMFGAAMTVIDELCAENAALRAREEKLAVENRRLLDHVAKLEAKLGRPAKTPRNSSVPPSQERNRMAGRKMRGPEPPHAAARHPGAHRLLCDNPTAVKRLRTATCPHCAADVSGVEQSAGRDIRPCRDPAGPGGDQRVWCCGTGHARAVARRSRRPRRRGWSRGRRSGRICGPRCCICDTAMRSRTSGRRRFWTCSSG